MELYRISGLRKRPLVVDGFRVNTSAVDVLRACDLLSDGSINNSIKVRICLRLLLKRGAWLRARLIPFAGQQQLLDKILDALIGKAVGGERIVDFRKDSELIYTALLQSFGLDLACDFVDWRIFPSLISAVSSQTRLYEIMRIRACEVPSVARAGEEYVSDLMRLKNKFSLDDASFEDGLQKLFDGLSRSL